MPSKSSRTRNIAEQPSSHHKRNFIPKAKSLAGSHPYLVVDATLPSHVINDRSLFTTYTPRRNIYRTVYGHDIIIEGTGDAHIRVLAAGQSICLRMQNCWHVSSSPHHFLSCSTVVSLGYQVMIAGNCPRMLFSHKRRLVEPNLPKYIPFTRVDHFIVLKFDIHAKDSLSPESPKSATGNASTSFVQTVLSLKASTLLPFAGLTFNRNPTPTPNVSFPHPSVDGAMAAAGVHRRVGVVLCASEDIVLHGGVEPLASYPSPPFTAGLNLDQMSESPKGAIATASAHEHAKVMLNLNTCHARVGASDGSHAGGGVDGLVGDEIGLKDDAHLMSHGGVDDQLVPVDVTMDILNGDTKAQDQEDIRDRPLVSRSTYIHPQFHQNHTIPRPFAQPMYQIPPLHTFSPSPSHSPSLGGVSFSKSLPTVTHIPFLNSKTDFFPWNEGVHTLIRANGLIGHILDPSIYYVDPSRPDLAPTPPPVLSMTPSPQQIEASNRWWTADAVVQHILVSRLGSIPRGLLPSANTISSSRTALSIYQTLMQFFGTCSFTDCTELLLSLHNSTCTSGRVLEFVSKWRVGISKLQSAHFVFNIKICISMFIRGLPHIPAFITLRADLPRRIAAVVHDRDCGAFNELTETVLELNTIFRQIPQLQASRPPRLPSVPVHPASLPVVQDSSSLVPRKKQTCTNCKLRGFHGIGHTDVTCFDPGGGMEGRREGCRNKKG